jgi:hypothetical protein
MTCFITWLILQPWRCSWRVSIDFQWTTRCYAPEDRTLLNYHCENLKSCTDHVLLRTLTTSKKLMILLTRRINQATNQLVYLLGLFLNPEDGGDMFLWNVSWLLADRTLQYMFCFLLLHYISLLSSSINPQHGSSIMHGNCDGNKNSPVESRNLKCQVQGLLKKRFSHVKWKTTLCPM